MSVPTTDQLHLGGGLTILSYNDLSNTPTPGSGAILINQPSSFASALASCNFLNEGLWTPTGNLFFEGLNNSLSYQVYQGLFPHDQLFWVSNIAEGSCRAISSQGIVSKVDCRKDLPALCTQSAPVSNFTFTDNSAHFQITHRVGQQSLTGYRDFFTWKFLGIRYAADPGRFEYSTVYDGTGNATVISQGADCLQTIGQVSPWTMSEDCLFLSIWTPYLPPTAPVPKAKLKPVMFYIYGGGFVQGSSANPNTDGGNLASRGDVIVVALNYRVGFLGFLAFEDGVHNGNYGIGDMVTALEWVAKNIEAFGGDPDNVTIFGESAGAISVRALLASPKAKGLFVNGIMQSDLNGLGAAGYFDSYLTIPFYYNLFTSPLLNQTGCLAAVDQGTCLQSVNGTIITSIPDSDMFPTIDDTYLVTKELALNNTSGYASNVAVISGTNRDEFGILLPDPPSGYTLEEFLGAFVSEEHLGINTTEILNSGLFDIPSDPILTVAQIFNVSERIGTDGFFLCLEEAKTYSAAKHNVFQSLYSYNFNRTYSTTNYTNKWCQAPPTASRPNGDPNLEYFKCYGAEQLIVFGNIKLGLPDRDGLDVPFEQLIVDYWSSFARTRNPNPEKEYLLARGYWETLAQVEAVGEWEQVVASRPQWRQLQWNGFQRDFQEIEQCVELGLPLDYYETH